MATRMRLLWVTVGLSGAACGTLPSASQRPDGQGAALTTFDSENAAREHVERIRKAARFGLLAANAERAVELLEPSVDYVQVLAGTFKWKITYQCEVFEYTERPGELYATAAEYATAYDDASKDCMSFRIQQSLSCKHKRGAIYEPLSQCSVQNDGVFGIINESRSDLASCPSELARYRSVRAKIDGFALSPPVLEPDAARNEFHVDGSVDDEGVARVCRKDLAGPFLLSPDASFCVMHGSQCLSVSIPEALRFRVNGDVSEQAANTDASLQEVEREFVGTPAALRAHSRRQRLAAMEWEELASAPDLTIVQVSEFVQARGLVIQDLSSVDERYWKTLAVVVGKSNSVDDLRAILKYLDGAPAKTTAKVGQAYSPSGAALDARVATVDMIWDAFLTLSKGVSKRKVSSDDLREMAALGKDLARSIGTMPKAAEIRLADIDKTLLAIAASDERAKLKVARGATKRLKRLYHDCLQTMGQANKAWNRRQDQKFELLSDRIHAIASEIRETVELGSAHGTITRDDEQFYRFVGEEMCAPPDHN